MGIVRDQEKCQRTKYVLDLAKLLKYFRSQFTFLEVATSETRLLKTVNAMLYGTMKMLDLYCKNELSPNPTCLPDCMAVEDEII